jgi:enamine deaminase RidA (YjgF/YER057c/UK114 family)
LSLGALGVARGQEPAVQRVPGQAEGTSAAVVVRGNMPLAHTAQLQAKDAQGRLQAPGRAGEQAERVLEHLGAALGEAGSGLDRLVKLNVYAASPSDLPAIRHAVSAIGHGKAAPAVCYVVGPLSDPEALVAMDAVASTARAASAGPRISPRVSVLRPGVRVYVSGQAAASTDLGEATRKTLAQLAETLKFLGMDRADVVQVKSFLQPAAGAAQVEREMKAFFGAEATPPLVFVAWHSPKTQPIEIELIAGTGRPGTAATEALEYLTPPHLKPSPVFCRVVRVNRGDLIYTTGLLGTPKTTGSAQVESVFDALKRSLAVAGGDLRHLVKATYYVTDDEASKALNALRPRYYDPKRPPAASKANVDAVDDHERSLTLDMIAVTAESAGK